jgi:H+/Cl- antiporter ClcA
MKPKFWAILSGCVCGFLTMIGGTAILAFISWSLFEAGVRDIAGIENNAKTMLPFAIGISAFLAIIVGFVAGLLIYRWRQRKEEHRPPVQSD